MVKMQFNYYDKNNQIKQLNIEVGKEWISYKEKDNSQNLLNSVFNFVDQNSNGKVDKEELNILQRLIKIADSQIEKFKNNNVLENEELELLVDKIRNEELDELEGNKNPQIIDTADNRTQYTNFTYLSSFYQNGTIKVIKVIVDYSALNNLTGGKYYVASWNTIENENGTITKTPKNLIKIQNTNQDGTNNWSEGINRNISKIQFVNSSSNTELIKFMNMVGQEQGFQAEFLQISGANHWAEDQSVVRADKKQLIPNCESDFSMLKLDKDNEIIAKRKNVTLGMQGNPIGKNSVEEEPRAINYSHAVLQSDIIKGKTYLEGGNVLNTLTKNGEPGAVIGEESLKYTMVSMMSMNLDGSVEAIENIEALDLDNADEYRIKAKKQIAKELGVKEENVTYIPQFDFHIDMYYRPLNNGQMAIPDYKAGIEVLNRLLQDIDTQIESKNISSEQNENLQHKKQEFLKLLSKLEEMKNKTDTISTNAENELKEKGYDVVKIPCFTEIDDGKDQGLDAKSVENPINYMNGVCGTSAKTGDKYYITNSSGDEILDKYMENYFKSVVGFDKIYFAPTKQYLSAMGGIDCLTKEF